MDSRRQFITLAGLLLLMLFVFAGIENYELDAIHAEILENVGAADTAVEGLNQARIAEARFKNQVQEWKNILLRGDEPEDFRRYRAAFEAEAGSVHDALDRLRNLAPPPPEADTAAPERLLRAHSAVLARYLEALPAGDLDRIGDAHAVDAAVRGVDRQFTDDLRTFAAAMAAQAEAASRKVSLDAVARIEDQKRAALIKAALASAVIVLLVIVFLAFRRTP